jgi:hypothetical protein
MTNRNKRIYEMLVRVLVFRSTYSNLIAKGSTEDKLFDELEAAHNKLSQHATLQASGKSAGRLSSSERQAAREDLRTALDILCRTAASMGLKQFFLPHDKGDRSLANVGRVFLPLLEPLKKEFLDNHLPEDFIEKLKSAVEKIESSITQQAVTTGAHVSATTGIASAQAKALAALNRLDPIIENLLRGNETVKAVWDGARRVEKVSSTKSASPPEAASAATAA